MQMHVLIHIMKKNLRSLIHIFFNILCKNDISPLFGLFSTIIILKYILLYFNAFLHTSFYMMYTITHDMKLIISYFLYICVLYTYIYDLYIYIKKRNFASSFPFLIN